MSDGAACERCEGCGMVANSADGEPWTHWERLPEAAKVAVRLGLVRPIACPDCGRREARPAMVSAPCLDCRGRAGGSCFECAGLGTVMREEVPR